MTKKKIRYMPFLIISIIHFYTWIRIVFTDNDATSKHVVALLLICTNLFLYIKKMSYGLLATAIILLLSSLSLIDIYTNTIVSSYFIKIGRIELSTPNVQWRSVLILLLYFILNINYWIDAYADFKYRQGNND